MFRDQIDILEGVMMEGALEALNQARKMPGIGEYLEYSFEEASSPMELANSIQGLYKTIQQARTYHDVATLKDYGFTHMADVQQFMNFAASVSRDPAAYFEAYQGTADTTMGGEGMVDAGTDDIEEGIGEDCGCDHEMGMQPEEDPDVYDILQNVDRMM